MSEIGIPAPEGAEDFVMRPAEISQPVESTVVYQAYVPARGADLRAVSEEGRKFAGDIY